MLLDNLFNYEQSVIFDNSEKKNSVIKVPKTSSVEYKVVSSV